MKRQMTGSTKVASAALVGAAVVGIALYAAAPFTPSAQPTGYVGGIALSNDVLMVDAVSNPSGGGKLYRPWYENGAWQGDIVEYDVDASGNTTPALLALDDVTNLPTNLGSNWSARIKFNERATADANWWDTNRKIITYSGGTQVKFRWSALTDPQKTAFDADTPTTDATSAALDYIRGQRDYEAASAYDIGLDTDADPATYSHEYRDRWNVLGDIIHSTPVYVGAPKATYSFDNYDLFRDDNTNKNRSPRVYVGANDGMLHAFNAVTGEEVYAYVPSMLLGNLKSLVTKHGYMVDGPIAVADAKVNGQWRTVLVGALGAGGKGLYALDITNPDLSSESASGGTDAKILWELNADSDDDLGYTYSQPTITRFNDGKWYVVIGNGYNSVNGKAKLYVINLDDGTVAARIATDGSGSTAAPNGLSSPILIDPNGDAKADYAYAGDIDGNLWKFDLTSLSVALGGQPLFVAGPTKPITTRPDVTGHLSGYMVYFGTGRILTATDLATPDVQTIYGIWDKGATVTDATLQLQTLTEKNYSADTVVRVMSNNAMDWNTHRGWKVNLPAGERLVTDPALRAKRLQMVTTNPTADPQENWMMQLNYLTGGPPTTPIMDLSGDDVLSSADNVDGNGDGDLLDSVDVVTGLKLDTGATSGLTFGVIDVVSGQGAIDTTFYNAINLPYIASCTDECLGGFYGGHVDVDTDSPKGPNATSSDTSDGLGGHTDGHQHEYDKANGVVYVDLLGPATLDNDPADDPTQSRLGKLEPRRNLTSLDAQVANGTKVAKDNNSLEEVKNPDGSAAPISGAKQFFVTLANADLSPGGTIRIGKDASGKDREWNVVDYQNMITSKLLAAGKIGVAGASVNAATFKDDNGNSLVFTLDDIKANGGTIRVSFSNKAIIEGGLHATSYDCVRSMRNPYTNASVSESGNYHLTPVPSGASKDPNADKGFRWRNGALVVHIMDASNFTLEPTTYLPQTTTGTLVGGVYPQLFSSATSSSSKGLTGIVPAEGPNESGMLYEHVTFWHYGDLYTYRTGKNEPCYGASNYNSTKTIETGGLTLGEYQKFLNGMTNDSANIKAYADAVIAVNKCLADSACTEAELNSLVKTLYAAINVNSTMKNYVKYRGYAPGHIPDQHLLNIDKAGNSSGTSTGSGGVVATKPGDYTFKDIKALGPNYQPGRRTWTDISPE